MADAGDRGEVQALIARLAGEFLDDGGALAREVLRRIHSEVVGLPGDDEFRSATLESGTRIIHQIASQLRDGGDMGRFEPPAASIGYAEQYVHRGVDISVLLGVIRVGYAVFAEAWSRRLRADQAPAGVIAEALGQSLLDIFAYVDTISGGLASAYSQERERWSRSMEAMRVDLTRALLDGHGVDLDLAEQRLGHRLTTAQRAFLVWTDADYTTDLPAALRAAAREITSRAGAEHCLLLPLGGKTLAGWISGIPAGRPGERFPCESLSGPATPGVWAAVGATRPGIAGFTQSHEQARAARRIARLGQYPAGTVTAYDDVSLLALASVDPRQARAFVAHELGPLAAPDQATRRIAETLGTYLDSGRNRARTSRCLGLHSNTIAYRLQRASEMLGHPLDDRAAEVEIALRLLLGLGDGDWTDGTSGTDSTDGSDSTDWSNAPNRR